MVTRLSDARQDDGALVAQTLLGAAQYTGQLTQIAATAIGQLHALEIVPDAFVRIVLAVASLKRHRLKQHDERLKHGPDWNPQQLAFCTTTGTAYARHNWRLQQYMPMLEKAGLPYIRTHDLCHTAVTLFLMEGVRPLVVSEMLGHTSVAFTLATYGHVQADMRKPARDAMERLFGRAFQARSEQQG